MAITHPTGFPLGLNGDKLSTPAPPTVTFPHSYANVGDLGVLGVLVPNSIAPSAITGTNSGSWTRRARINDTTNNVTVDIWTATVTSTSGADVVTPTYGGTTTGQFGDFWMDSLTAGFGTSTVWSFPASNAAANGANVTMQYPSLVAATTTNSQAYWGVAGSGSNAQGGTTSGFSYIDSTSNSGNEQIYNLSLTSGTTYAPTSTQDFSVVSDVAGLIIQAANGGGGGGGGSVTAAGNFFFALNGGNTSFPPPEVTSLSATSGPAAGGTAVQVNGVFFSGASTVKFGSTSVGFNLTNPQTITTTSPAGTAGATVNVSVTTPSGTSTNAAGNQFSYPSSGGGGTIPNVPAGVQIPTKLILGPGVAGGLGTAGEFNAYPSGSFPTSGANNPGIFTNNWGGNIASGVAGGQALGPTGNANPTTCYSNNLSISSSGLVITLGGFQTNTTGCVTTNPSWTNPGFQFQPSAGNPVFVQWTSKLSSVSGSFGACSTEWMTGQSWPQTGEIDIVETQGSTTIDYTTIWNAGGNVNGPGLPFFQSYQSYMNGTVTYGCLWTTTTATFYYNGVQQGGVNTLGYLLGPFYLVASLTLPATAGQPQTHTIQNVRVWQGPTSAHP